MAQKTNLNINPYYDDFDSEKNFKKVLFKPGFPVQARELTTSQSILQNQLESFGTNIFKDGSVVVPGSVAYDNNYYSVRLKSSNFGIDISAYIKNFIGKNIIGQTSGVEAKIRFVLLPEEDSRVDDVTIYVSYNTNAKDFNQTFFSDGEEIVCNENITYGLTTINAGEVFASLITSEATSIGSAAFIKKGVYFIRGYFVNVSEQKIVLDPYTNNSSYRVGLQVNENIITAKDDESLFDNAKGFSNFAAPGADRFNIELTLIKKDLTDSDDTDFVELMRIDNGQIKVIQTDSEYNIIRDYMADRTFDESGHYTVNPFEISIFNSLNNGLGNGGLYYPQQLTEQQNIPDNDLMCVKISSGRAYVAGYDVDKIGTTILDVEKPRDVGIRSDVSVGYELGNLLKVNKVSGLPEQASVIKLYNNFNGTGEIIGSARVYSFNLEDANYEDDTTVWDLRLFDLQTYTSVTLNESVTNSGIRVGSYIKGKNSGASGYSIDAGSGTSINVVQTSGTFHKGEQIEIDGSDDVSRTIGIATAYNTQNIKSISGGSFSANSVLETFRIPNGISAVSITVSSGTATARSEGKAFTGLRVGSVVRYQRAGIDDETYNKVSNISSDGKTITLEAIATDVTGVYDGNLPSDGTYLVSMFAGGPIVRGSGQLFVSLANRNISTLDLSKSEFKISKIITTTASANIITLDSNDISDIPNSSYEPFDAEKYSIAKNDNTIVPITASTRNTDGSEITLNAVAGADAKVLASLSKKDIVSKKKFFSRSRKVTISKSKNQSSGNNDGGNNAIANGLRYDNNHMYGTRVEDEEICLNYPDVVKIIAILESTDTSAATFDTLSFDSTLNVNNNAIVGENIISLDGKIVARVVGKSTDKVEIIYLSSNRFDIFDGVKFEDSNIQGEIKAQTEGKYKDLTNSFKLDKGQRDQYYDYSRIVRNPGTSSPSRQLTIVFDHYTVPAGDNGDAFTVLSYDRDRFRTDIPSIGINPVRASDTIDFRPRVPVYDPSTATVSPFHYSSRSFDSSSITRFLVPEETLTVAYEYYLPRIDKLFLNKYGKFVYKKGLSAESPKSPINGDDKLMEIASINLPPFLYTPQSAIISEKDNRRYTMRDIGKLENRLTNLEETTSLSLLELDAKSLQVQSAGLDRFKTGFFVDSFRDYSFINPILSSIEINPDANEITPFITRNTLESQVTPAESVIPDELDFGTDFELLDSNVKKTGNAVTLNYEEVSWIEQPKATETENVNPYEQPALSGSVELTPQTDFWSRTEQSKSEKTIIKTGKDRTKKLNNKIDLGEQVINLGSIITSETESRTTDRIRGRGDDTITSETTITDIDTISQSINLKGKSEDSVTFSNKDIWFKNELISSGNDDYMRSRNTEFKGYGFGAFTQVYGFLDSQTPIIVPKLIEISTSKGGETNGSVGSFSKGETILVYDPVDTSKRIGKIRLCSPDHKEGPIKKPTETYLYVPSSHGEIELGKEYTSSTPVLNIDTRGLSERAQGKFSGYIKKNSKIVGKKSGAVAFVKGDIRLITDVFGGVIGTFFIEDPYDTPTPEVRFKTGSTEFTLTTSENNVKSLPGQQNVVRAAATYETGGTVDQWEQQKFKRVDTTTIESKVKVSGSVGATLTTQNQHTHVEEAEYFDPVAQTFVVGGNVEAPSAVNQNNDKDGAFLTAVEVFFATIDEEHPVRCQIRTVTGDDRPSRFVLAEKELRPKISKNGAIIDNILTSDDASIPTKFTFDEPIYLAPGTAYAIVLVAEKSVNYTVWLANQGDKIVNPEASSAALTENFSVSGNEVVEQTQYTTQYALGSFFKSQNGGLWTENQRQDLTFRLYKAKFTSQLGTVSFNNPQLDESNGYVKELRSNPIRTLPKTGKIGIQTSGSLTSTLVAGRKIASPDTNKVGSAVITGSGGEATTPTVVSGLGGKNYVVDTVSGGDGGGGVETFAITGKGTGLTLDIDTVDANGAITAVDVISAGFGYQVGDVVGIVTSTVTGATGSGAQIKIGGVTQRNMIFVENIQGNTQFSDNLGSNLFYYADDGTITDASLDILSVSFDGGVNDGNYLKVDHFNHGMYSSTNKVKLSDVEPNTIPTTIVGSISESKTGSVSIADTTGFAKFEGLDVSESNPGYAIINNEVIKYNSVISGSPFPAGSLTISTDGRGEEDTSPSDHSSGDVIKKYELNGISLRRINNVTHTISSLGLEDDSYHIEIDRSSTYGVDRSADSSSLPQVSFTSDEFAGGDDVLSTENILFNAVIPSYDIITPTGGNESSFTSADASIRTITATSISGNEPSFNDNGFESISLNRYNALRSVRMVASKVNEDEYLSSLPRSKSFTTNIILSSNNENLSPMIYLNGGSSTEFISNRLNQPIDPESYSSNRLIKSIDEKDPHSSVYVSQDVFLRQPSTSLKVIVAAYRHESSDFRMAYKLIREDSTSIEQSFELFPGFKNFDSRGNVIDSTKNDGRPDTFVPPNSDGEFSEYVFTADNLDQFVGYSVKIMMNGTNQAYYPRIKDLRTIALA
jgi:hypothetical protein